MRAIVFRDAGYPLGDVHSPPKVTERTDWPKTHVR